MRHQVSGKKLSRDSGQRKALFKSLINSLVTRGQIKTTESKAKAVRPLVEKLMAATPVRLSTAERLSVTSPELE